MLTIVHFSQDFQKNKSQLGGFSRIYSICRDGNRHIIFTINKQGSFVEDWFLGENIQVVAIPLFGRSFTRLEQITLYKDIGDSITKWLTNNTVKPDILFGHSHLVNYFILKHVKQAFVSTKLLWETNVIWGIHPTQGIAQKLAMFIVFNLQKYILHDADHIVSQTESSKFYLRDRFNISLDNITVVENAVLDSEILPYNEDASRKYLCFGLFDKMNGIPFLLDYIKSQSSTIDVHFYGNGLYVKDVEAYAANKKLTYHGSILKSQMLQELKKYKYVVIPRLPEIEADLFIPTKLVECMANGVVPICSDVRGMSEVVKHGVNGFLYKAGDLKDFDNLINKLNQLEADEYKAIQKSAIDTIRQNYLWTEKHKKLTALYTKNK